MWVWLALGLLVVGAVLARETKRHRDRAREQAARAAQVERQRRDSIARESAAAAPQGGAAQQRSLEEVYGAAARAARGIYTLQFVDREKETQRAQALAQELAAARTGVESLQGELPSGKLEKLRAHNDSAARRLDELSAALGSNPPDFVAANGSARAIEREMAEAYNTFRGVAGDPHSAPMRPRLDLRSQYRQVPMKAPAR